MATATVTLVAQFVNPDTLRVTATNPVAPEAEVWSSEYKPNRLGWTSYEVVWHASQFLKDHFEFDAIQGNVCKFSSPLVEVYEVDYDVEERLAYAEQETGWTGR